MTPSLFLSFVLAWATQGAALCDSIPPVQIRPSQEMRSPSGRVTYDVQTALVGSSIYQLRIASRLYGKEKEVVGVSYLKDGERDYDAPAIYPWLSENPPSPREVPAQCSLPVLEGLDT